MRGRRGQLICQCQLNTFNNLSELAKPGRTLLVRAPGARQCDVEKCPADLLEGTSNVLPGLIEKTPGLQINAVATVFKNALLFAS